MDEQITKREFKYLTDLELQGLIKFVEGIKILLKENLLNSLLFGSKVVGNFDQNSDIDILIVVKDKNWAIKKAICSLATEIDLIFNINLSPVIYSQKEMERNVYFNNLFIQHIQGKGIKL